MLKIMFVCHGNICRSPMAEFIFKNMICKNNLIDLLVASSATSREEIGNDIYPYAKEKLDQMNIPYNKRQAVQLTKSDYEKYDLFIGMDSRNISNMLKIFGKDPQNKVHLLLEFANEKCDVADPWYTGDFNAAYNDIFKGCSGLIDFIKCNYK